MSAFMTPARQRVMDERVRRRKEFEAIMLGKYHQRQRDMERFARLIVGAIAKARKPDRPQAAGLISELILEVLK